MLLSACWKSNERYASVIIALSKPVAATYASIIELSAEITSGRRASSSRFSVPSASFQTCAVPSWQNFRFIESEMFPSVTFFGNL